MCQIDIIHNDVNKKEVKLQSIINYKTCSKSWTILPKQSIPSLSEIQNNEENENKKMNELELYVLKYSQEFKTKINFLLELEYPILLNLDYIQEDNSLYCELYWEFKKKKEIECIDKIAIEKNNEVINIRSNIDHIELCTKKFNCYSCNYIKRYGKYKIDYYNLIIKQHKNLQQNILQIKNDIYKYSQTRSQYFMDIKDMLILEPKLSMFVRQYYLLNSKIPEMRIFFFFFMLVIL